MVYFSALVIYYMTSYEYIHEWNQHLMSQKAFRTCLCNNNLAPVPPKIIRLNLEFDENCRCYILKKTNPVTKSFAHSKTAVLSSNVENFFVIR